MLPGAGVLTIVMGRRDEALSATETLERALSDADNLAVLSRRWIDLAGAEFSRRYDTALHRLIGPEQAAGAATTIRA